MKRIFRAIGRGISLGPTPSGVRVDLIEQTDNSITWQETEMTSDEISPAGRIVANRHPDDTVALLLKVTGQLDALQQANGTLIEKWRKRADDDWVYRIEHDWVVDECADELEAATKEATQ